MCVMDIMNVLRTGINMSISRIHIWLCNTATYQNEPGINCSKRATPNTAKHTKWSLMTCSLVLHQEHPFLLGWGNIFLHFSECSR